ESGHPVIGAAEHWLPQCHIGPLRDYWVPAFAGTTVESHFAGGSIAALRRSGALAGSAMNLMNAATTSGCFDAASTPAPTCPHSLSRAGRGPRSSVPGWGWITLVC